MPKFVIEREIPGAGKLSPQELHAIAPDEKTVRKHAELGGFPANRVSRVTAVIDPTTAE